MSNIDIEIRKLHVLSDIATQLEKLNENASSISRGLSNITDELMELNSKVLPVKREFKTG